MTAAEKGELRTVRHLLRQDATLVNEYDGQGPRRKARGSGAEWFPRQRRRLSADVRGQQRPLHLPGLGGGGAADCEEGSCPSPDQRRRGLREWSLATAVTGSRPRKKSEKSPRSDGAAFRGLPGKRRGGGAVDRGQGRGERREQRWPGASKTKREEKRGKEKLLFPGLVKRWS